MTNFSLCKAGFYEILDCFRGQWLFYQGAFSDNGWDRTEAFGERLDHVIFLSSMLPFSEAVLTGGPAEQYVEDLLLPAPAFPWHVSSGI